MSLNMKNLLTHLHHPTQLKITKVMKIHLLLKFQSIGAKKLIKSKIQKLALNFSHQGLTLLKNR